MRRVRIPGMAQVDPDIAALFAPLRPAQASNVVLREAREVLAHLHKPIDAELWGSDIIGALSSREGDGAEGADSAEVMAELASSLVPAAEVSGTPEALALLRILAAIGSPALTAAMSCTNRARAAEAVSLCACH